MNADLVLEGGGVKGIALVGAIDVLQEAGYTFPRVAGTSAGAIVGALVAAGMPAGERHQLLQSVDYRRFQDEGLLDRVPLVGKPLSLVLERGMYEGAYLRRWMAEQLEACGCSTFDDLRITDPGSTLPPERAFRLVVMASDICYGRLRRLPWDYPALGIEDPGHVPVADAVRASMSIPLFFEPVTMKVPGKPDVCLVDGGMLSNFPVDVFDRTDGQPPRWPTFGIKLSARAGAVTPKFDPSGLPGLVRSMVGTMTSFRDQMHLDGDDVLDRTIFVDTMGVRATDFDLSAATRDALYANGRRAAERFLEQWDFAAYVAEHRSASAVPSPRESAPSGTSQPA